LVANSSNERLRTSLGSRLMYCQATSAMLHHTRLRTRFKGPTLPPSSPPAAV
jgi:hypothetical protein